jgi:hypothetical protein
MKAFSLICMALEPVRHRRKGKITAQSIACFATLGATRGPKGAIIGGILGAILGYAIEQYIG